MESQVLKALLAVGYSSLKCCIHRQLTTAENRLLSPSVYLSVHSAPGHALPLLTSCQLQHLSERSVRWFNSLK